MLTTNKIQIIILAAGKGTRMKTDLPKALTLFKGKPFLKHILDTIESLHLPTPPIIVVGHKKENIFEALGEGHNYIEQKELLGTGHAVNSTKEHLSKDTDTVLVISADQPLISKETLLTLIKKHTEENAVLTLATAPLPDFINWRENLKTFGRIVRDENNKLLKVVEYKDASEEEKEITEVNPAIYAFDNSWLWNNIDKLKNENSQKEYYLTDLIQLAVDQNLKIETTHLSNILESLQPNSLEEVKTLEDLAI